MRAKGDWDYRNSDLVKNLDELLFNPCGDFGEVRNAQLTKSILLSSTLVPLESLQIF